MSSPTAVPPRPGSAAAKQQARQQAKQPTPQFKKHRKPDEPPGRSALTNPWLIGGVLAVIVLVIGTISILSTTSSDPSDREPIEQTRAVAASGAALPLLPDGGADPAIGLVAPTVTGEGFGGGGVEIGAGAPTLVTFLAHWCPHCQAEVPELVAWNRSGLPTGLRVVGVSTSVDERRDNYPPSDWLAREGFPFTVMADSAGNEAATAFGVSGFPFFVLLDADGTVVWRGSGELPVEQLEATIADTLGI